MPYSSCNGIKTHDLCLILLQNVLAALKIVDDILAIAIDIAGTVCKAIPDPACALACVVSHTLHFASIVCDVYGN